MASPQTPTTPAAAPGGNSNAIEAHALARSFDGRPAVESLDLTVLAGEMFCLVGPDGAGKSTVIRLLSGIIDPTGGDATVLGMSLLLEASAIRTRVGYLSQSFTLYGDLSVDENIEFFANLHGVHDYPARRDELLDFTRLAPARGRLAGNLSGGMKKKLALACTLIHTPEIVFLDEPSTGVDPVSRGEFWNILSGVLDRGMTIVMTTPYLDEAERCDRVGLLDRGRIIASGRPEEIRSSTPGSVHILDSPDARASYRELRTRWGSTQLVLSENRLRFWSPSGDDGAREAARLLEHRGKGPVTLRTAEPTLEDAFVALLAVHGDAGDVESVGPASGDEAPEQTRLGRTDQMTPAPDAVIVVDNVTKRFGRFTAVDGLSFSVREGEVFGFLGPNGAGKSTTIRMLCGLIGTTTGAARVAGFDVNDDPEQVRQHIGYMSQRFSLYRDLTVAENIRFFGGTYGLEDDRLRTRYRDVVRLAGLEGLEDELTGALSGALAQRLALGCAVIHEPPILFLDEPTSGVDPISRRLFWDLVREMSARGVTVLITTHFMDEAEFCDRIGFIASGRLIALGPPDEIRGKAVSEDLFSVSLRKLSGAREKIEAIRGIVATTYFGQRLHVFARPGSMTAGRLEQAIHDTGLEVVSVTPSRVTLEDAFVRLAQAGEERSDA